MARFMMLTTLLAVAAGQQCPDYAAMDSPPALPWQTLTKHGFRKWRNTMLVWALSPQHLVFDQLVAEGTNPVMVGKFEYGAVARKDLEKETVTAWIHGTGMAQWESLGSFKTNGDGKIFAPAGIRPAGEYVIAMVVSGDASVVYGYLTVIQQGQKAILFDIDGTLTTSDFEAVWDLVGLRTAEPYAYARDMVLAYKAKGYKVVYLTSRIYCFSKETREWFAYMGIPAGHLHHQEGSDLLADSEAYKTDYIKTLQNTGLDIVRAYGNADTDVLAYANRHLPKSETYIIGENAGMSNTQPVDGDYGMHLMEVVIPTPNSDCTAL